jgi:hypothetical protein
MIVTHVFKNENTGDVFETSDSYDIHRLTSLENWTKLSGKDAEKALEVDDAPVVISEIGEVLEQYEQHGAGTKYDPDALNEDKASHAADSTDEGQEPKPLEDMTVKDLRQFAKDNNIELGGARSKEEIADLIKASEPETEPTGGGGDAS